MPTDATGTPTSLGIPTLNTSADAPSGLGFNEAMAVIDTLLAARVTKPAGIVSGEVPVWNGTTWARSSATPLTAGITSVGSGSGAAANQDLAAPTTSMYYYTVNTAGGGSLRSLGAPPSAGSRVSIRAGLPSGTVTILHLTAGGTGQQFFLRNGVNLALAKDESMDFMYDGSLWVEQTRDQASASTTPSVSTQTASYTAVLGDANNVVLMNVATANTFTVPPNSSVAFGVGTSITVAQQGAGQTSFVAGAGVTILDTPGLKIAAQNGAATLLKIATDTWLLFGNLTA